MKNMTLKLIASLVLAAVAYAQPSVTSTTLSAAVTSAGAGSITVASATGITAGTTALKVDNEMFRVISVSSTTIRVGRGAFGSRATKHGSGSTVYIGPLASFGQCSGAIDNQTPCGTNFGPNFSAPKSLQSTEPATVTTATAVTLTAGQVLGGLILEDPNGGAATATLPTAALLVAAVPGAMLNTSFEFTVRNTADAAETLTIAVGSGGTGSGTLTIAQNNTKRFLIRFTNVNPGAEAYTLYSLGTSVH